MNRRSHWLAPCVLLLALGLLSTAGGCAVAEQAEALFMRQQSAQGALASTVSEVEMASPSLAERLYGLEDELHAACSPLRKASQRRLEGEDVGTDLEWAVVTSLKRCESTTGLVERLVQQAGAGKLRRDPALETLPAAFDGH